MRSTSSGLRLPLTPAAWWCVAAALWLAGCAGLPFIRHRATLPVGEEGGKVLRAASHVLGKPERALSIQDVKGDAGIDIVTFDVRKGGNLALYFYKGTFVQVGSFSPDTGFSPIRTDFRDIQHRRQGPDAFVLERRGKTVFVRTVTSPPKP